MTVSDKNTPTMDKKLTIGDLVEAWQEVEDPIGAPERRTFGVLIEVIEDDGLMSYKVGMGSGFFGHFIYCKKRNWSPEDMKNACMEIS